MKMSKLTYSAIEDIAHGLLIDSENIVKDIVESKGENYSGRIREYLDMESDKCIDKEGTHPVFSMMEAFNKALSIISDAEIVE